MSRAELQAALERVQKRAPEGWFCAQDVGERKQVMEALGLARLVESRTSLTCPYYRIKRHES